VRVKRYGTSEYFWVGYVQDVSQRIVFGNRSSNTAPFVMTTIYCNDWVGYLSQFQAVGVGGVNYSTGAIRTTSDYNWRDRVGALNKIIDSAYTTPLITAQAGTPSTPNLGDTDLVGTFSEHLNLFAAWSDVVWFGTHTLPTNITTGRADLINVNFLSSLVSSSKTFTDVAGTSGQLHYTEIDFENSTQNVANNIVVNNRVRFHVPVTDVEVTKIGGFNENNYVVVNNSNVVGIINETSQNKSSSTSITSYGPRQASFDACIALSSTGAAVNAQNLLANPSVEYSDDGYFGDATTVTRRRKPSEDANPFDAYSGLWAMRMRCKGATNSTPIIAYTGSETDGTPVVAGNGYYFYARVARGVPNRTDARVRARVKWYDADETALSTTYGTQVSLSSSSAWVNVGIDLAFAPTNAVRAQVGVEFNRSGGGNFSAGDVFWADAFTFHGNSGSSYFDGDTPTSSSYISLWTGGNGASPSYLAVNKIDDAATSLLTKYSTTSMRVSRIRWNAQEDLTAVSSLTVGKTISLVYKSTTTTYRIVGIDGTVDPDRYMIDYYLAKV